MILSAILCLGKCKQTLEPNLGLGESKLGFWGEEWSFPESTSDSIPCFMFLRLFTSFCFELALGVNTKVVDNFVSFPVALVGPQNDVLNLSYRQITTRRSQ